MTIYSFYKSKVNLISVLELPTDGYSKRGSYPSTDCLYVNIIKAVKYSELLEQDSRRMKYNNPVLKIVAKDKESNKIIFDEFIDSEIRYRNGKEVPSYVLYEDQILELMNGNIELVFEEPEEAGISKCIGFMYAASLSDDTKLVSPENIELILELDRNERTSKNLHSNQYKKLLAAIMKTFDEEQIGILKDMFIKYIEDEQS